MRVTGFFLRGARRKIRRKSLNKNFYSVSLSIKNARNRICFPFKIVFLNILNIEYYRKKKGKFNFIRYYNFIRKL